MAVFQRDFIYKNGRDAVWPTSYNLVILSLKISFLNFIGIYSVG